MAVKLGALVVIILFVDVNCKVYNQALTESMGQEVIEMASPDKELPADLEEEPSAESVEGKSTSTTVGGATRNVPAKIPSNISRRVNSAKDEELRIEKELAELYKDPDYKDSGEVNKTDGRKSAAKVEKPVHKPNLKLQPDLKIQPDIKFQPDDYSEVGLAKFRTRMDRIECTTDRKTPVQTRETVEPKQRVMVINADKDNSKSSAARVGVSLCLLPLAVHL